MLPASIEQRCDLLRSHARRFRERVRLTFLRKPPLDNLLLTRVEHAEGEGDWRQPAKGIVLAHRESKLRARREEPIRLIDTARHEIVHEHADI